MAKKRAMQTGKARKMGRMERGSAKKRGRRGPGGGVR